MSGRAKTFGPYKLVQELGRGRRTVVHKAWESDLQRYVTLKVLRDKDDPRALKKLQKEAQLSARFKNPGVRRIYQVGQTPDGYAYVVMEYVEQSLKDLIMQRRAQKRVFARQEVAHLLTPIAEALDDIHRQGLVHLDIKPRNILVSQAGHAVLADFGIARQRGEQTAEGTPRYTSPEQAAGNCPVGPWSDVYALGALIYEMVAGRPPFVGEQDVVLLHQHLQTVPPAPRQFNPRLDRDLERTLLAALGKDPRQRPPSAGALLQAVGQRRATPIVGSAGAALRRTTDVIRRRPQLALVPLVLLTLLVLLPLAFKGGNGEPSPTPTPSPRPPTHTHTPIPPTQAPVVASETPVTPETATPLPSSTPWPSPTPSSTSARPISTMGAAGIDLLKPGAGEEVQGTGPVTFRWAGQLSSGQYFVVHLIHERGNLQSGRLTTTSWETPLPPKQFGEWHWYVAIGPGGGSSAQRFFWFQPYPTLYPTVTP